jgi:hypothetical protein
VLEPDAAAMLPATLDPNPVEVPAALPMDPASARGVAVPDDAPTEAASARGTAAPDAAATDADSAAGKATPADAPSEPDSANAADVPAAVPMMTGRADAVADPALAATDPRRAVGVATPALAPRLPDNALAVDDPAESATELVTSGCRTRPWHGNGPGSPPRFSRSAVAVLVPDADAMDPEIAAAVDVPLATAPSAVKSRLKNGSGAAVPAELALASATFCRSRALFTPSPASGRR